MKSWNLSKALTGTLLLILLITSVYAPFLGSRFIRTAGDEKVYVSQALEMERAGTWFVQTLQDEPNYYKGPFHYLLLRTGMKIFGRSPWAALYMNYLLALVGALALAAILRRRYPEWQGGDVWTGAAFALGTGIYAHAFASQMEIELAALFAVGAWLLDRMNRRQAGWLFWCLVGLIGWIKSPLHSVFLSMSAAIYWTLNGELLPRLKNPRSWLALGSGIFVGVAGFLPAYFLDPENFWNNYIVREILRKSDGSGQGWEVAVVSTFGFYLFPWIFLGLVAYLQTLFRGRQLFHDEASRRLITLGFALFLPSTVFFCWHIYRFENYNLPVIAGVWLWIAAVWGAQSRNTKTSSSSLWGRLYAGAFGLTGLIFLALPIAMTWLAIHFSPLPNWWPTWLLPWIWFGSLVSALGFIFLGGFDRARRPHWLALSSGGFLWALGALFVVLGEREMLDLRVYLQNAQTQGRIVKLDYYNLNRNIWSEWGYLNFWIHHEVRGLHTPEALRMALLQGDTILVPAKEDGIRDFNEFVQKNFPTLPLRAIRWKRWRTRGQSSTGKPLWQEAWEKQDLTLLEVDYLIVEPLNSEPAKSEPTKSPQ